jgi:hypothetical protein
VKHIVLTIAALIVVYCFFLPPRAAVVGPVAVAMQSAENADKVKLASIYRALADITKRDAGKQLTSLSAWRTCHSSALRLAVGGTDLPGKYPNLDRAVEQVLSNFFPLDDVPMTADLAAKISAACEEVAKQSGG